MGRSQSFPGQFEERETTVRHARRRIVHAWRPIGSETVLVSVEMTPISTVVTLGSEHRWGYGRTRDGKLLRYEVRHPPWATHRVRSFHVDVDWAALYGPRWAVLRDAEPFSTIVAVGSEVSVHQKVVLGAGVPATRTLPQVPPA